MKNIWIDIEPYLIAAGMIILLLVFLPLIGLACVFSPSLRSALREYGPFPKHLEPNYYAHRWATESRMPYRE